MEILLAGLMALVPAAAAPQATATDVGAGTTARTSYHAFQALRTCKTVTGAGGHTTTICASQAPRNCKTITASGGRTYTICLSTSRS
ncbi:hypothetical protein [Streptomyces sp.]|uniref:hypothetical protein n=1 Tax=Streptomyces sp. TaxID=1931 RepID=UPI002F951614